MKHVTVGPVYNVILHHLEMRVGIVPPAGMRDVWGYTVVNSKQLKEPLVSIFHPLRAPKLFS